MIKENGTNLNELPSLHYCILYFANMCWSWIELIKCCLFHIKKYLINHITNLSPFNYKVKEQQCVHNIASFPTGFYINTVQYHWKMTRILVRLNYNSCPTNNCSMFYDENLIIINFQFTSNQLLTPCRRCTIARAAVYVW